MDPIDRRLMLGAAGLAGVAALSKLASPVCAGPLDPPAGPIGPTGRTLDELYNRMARTDAGVAEPRIPVQSLPGSKTALHVISEPGSYYLTGNILGEPGKNGIEIRTNSAAVDLAGYALIGNGGLSGITSPESGGAFSVRGGAVSNWAEWGIDLQGAIGNGYLSGVECVVSSGCGGGLRVRIGRIQRCIAWGCAGNGVEAVFATIVDCTAGANGNVGIQAGQNSVVRNCAAASNGTGVYVFQNASVMDCAVEGDFGTGISAGSQCLVRGNQVKRCERGILVFNDGSRVELNNVVDAFTHGVQVTGTNNIVVSNTCRSSGSPLSIAPGNAHGPIVNVAGVGDISAVPNANHPWANFVY